MLACPTAQPSFCLSDKISMHCHECFDPSRHEACTIYKILSVSFVIIRFLDLDPTNQLQ